MRIEGKLAKWNDDRGFGFIQPTEGGPEVFVHISAFPRDGQRPQLGERLLFEIRVEEGKKKAHGVVCPDRRTLASARPRHAQQRHRPGPLSGLFGRLLPVLLLVALVTYGYGAYSDRSASRYAASPVPPRSAQAVQNSFEVSSFRCDGRQYCSQMTSCEEAKFFLRNCPNVKMDGDGNGIPCEQQWCGSGFR